MPEISTCVIWVPPCYFLRLSCKYLTAASRISSCPSTIPNRWRHSYGWLYSYPLQLPSIGVTHVVSCETDGQVSREDHESNIAVCSGCRCADKGHIGCCFKKQTSVFRLADGFFVDQHYDFAFVGRTLSFGQLLIE